MNELFGTDVDLTYCDITAGKTEAKKENYKIKTSCTSIDDIHNSKSNKLNKKRRKLKLQTTFINQSYISWNSSFHL